MKNALGVAEHQTIRVLSITLFPVASATCMSKIYCERITYSRFSLIANEPHVQYFPLLRTHHKFNIFPYFERITYPRFSLLRAHQAACLPGPFS